ncbi:MAG: 6-pyruvoyltetrahydropterin/6-carboxytetrahydropterin synthase [Candidatus Methanomethylophilaceae archaeon]|nr:6-pyruvoyltetrahydropterin/6-carboxytetrahydropterin synthase [Candidatus Methanomethylophilaceae archaeon]MDI3542072.1 6-pyruvoyltetrahydropterin/6-carboxytetrahydropterin synthase [Candidatus Methanomethylophilaceae archaeon]HIJ00826.1 6-pyruvoyl tetrahydropterin synthase family protein [Candidatus Methanomethylophilaceae archaeon]
MRIEIDGAHSGIRFSACHFITGHEKCARLHGHSYIIRLSLEGEIGSDGMIMDFVVLKRALRQVVNILDHRVLLPGNSKEASLEIGEEVTVISGGKRYVFPLEDVVILDVEHTTAEEMAAMILDGIIEDVELPSNVTAISLGLDEERGQTAWARRVL